MTIFIKLVVKTVQAYNDREKGDVTETSGK
jgi:hypothetical protein